MNWSAPSTIEGTGVHHGYATVPLRKGGHWQPAAAPFMELLGGAEWAVISKLAPGGYLLPHRDQGPYRHRVQIPLQPGGWYWDEEIGAVRMIEGENVVRHHLTHAVWNDTDADRIHLVIDRGVIHGDGDFRLYPDACPELLAFLENYG